MLKKIFFLIIFILLNSKISHASISTKNSMKIYQNCKTYIRYADGAKLGVVDMGKALTCTWYFRGMFDSSLFVETFNAIKYGKDLNTQQARLNGFCVPSSITPAQWVRVFVKYLDDNPQHLNRAATINSVAALRKYYKCRK